MSFRYAALENSKPLPGMIPGEAHHVAIVVSLVEPEGFHVGVSQQMHDEFGVERCNDLSDEIAEAVGRFFAAREGVN